jgi:hypothetical protein
VEKTNRLLKGGDYDQNYRTEEGSKGVCTMATNLTQTRKKTMVKESVISEDAVLREQLLDLLQGGNAHMSFDEVIAGTPLDKANTKPTNYNYTLWQLLEHMRLVQWDIVEFVVNPEHVSPDYPEGYWPPEDKKATRAQWEKTVRSFRADLKRMQDIVADPGTDFFSPIPHAPDYTIFREALLAADHNAYHIGEIATLRQILEIAPHESW